MSESDLQIYNWIVGSECYKKTVNQADKNKVQKVFDTGTALRPSANIAKAAWALGKRIYAANHQNPDPPPPPPPTKQLAARTYNKVLPNGSDARFCKQSPGVVVHGDGSFDDDENHYDSNGLHQTGPRDPNFQVPGLRLANNMNGMDPCTLYDGMTEWPKESYL